MSLYSLPLSLSLSLSYKYNWTNQSSLQIFFTTNPFLFIFFAPTYDNVFLQIFREIEILYVLIYLILMCITHMQNGLTFAFVKISFYMNMFRETVVRAPYMDSKNTLIATSYSYI